MVPRSELRHFIFRWNDGASGAVPAEESGAKGDEARNPRRVGKLERAEPILSLSNTLEGSRGRN
jgi:hypothetical protein